MCLSVVINIRFQTMGFSAHSVVFDGHSKAEQRRVGTTAISPSDTVCEIADGLASFKFDVGKHVGLPMSKCIDCTFLHVFFFC